MRAGTRTGYCPIFLGGDELRMLTALRKEYPDSGYVFTTERGTPFTTDAINRQVKIIGQRAGLPFPMHFHMLRHSCDYKLANDGIDTRAIQDWLGQIAVEGLTWGVRPTRREENISRKHSF